MSAVRVRGATVYNGDCLDVMATLAALGTQVDSIVTDPPYHLTTVKRFANGAPAQYGSDGLYQRASKGFMGKEWDGGDVAFQVETWRRCYDLLKPGGYLLAFSGSRTYHRMACAIEDAGFEIRDQLMWLYSTGFPKSRDVAWDIHKMACVACGPMVEICDGDEQTARSLSQAEHGMRFVRATYLQTPVYACYECGQVLQPFLSEHETQELRSAWSQSETIWPEQPGLEGWGHMETPEGQLQRCEACTLPHGVFADGAQGRLRNGASSGDGAANWQVPNADGSRPSYRPRSVEQLHNQSDAFSIERYAQTVRGSGVNLKPAHEPIVMARKPLIGTVAENVLTHGTGAINIDACRVATTENLNGGAYSGGNKDLSAATSYATGVNAGTYVQPAGRFPANVLHDGSDEVLEAFARFGESTSKQRVGTRSGKDVVTMGHHDQGTAARFFYTAKASKKDRAGSKHPTVKPIALIEYLCRMVTRAGGVVLDPFAGSGTLADAWPDTVLIERDGEYFLDIIGRLARRDGEAQAT